MEVDIVCPNMDEDLRVFVIMLSKEFKVGLYVRGSGTWYAFNDGWS